MRAAIILCGAVVALSGCGEKTVTATNATPAEVAEKVASAQQSEQFISPGRWEATMTIHDMTIPGMPPEMAARMKSMTAKPKTFDSCVTPEEAKKPKEDFSSGNNDKSCRYDSFSMGAGVISAVMHCSSDGATQTMKMKGTYGPESYHIDIDTSASGKSQAEAMTMSATMDAKRTGECTGKERT